MGAWADLTLNQTVIEGLSLSGLRERGTEVFDTSLLTPERTRSAKDSAARELRSKAGAYILQQGGEVLFFDALAASADLENSRDELIGLAFLKNIHFERMTAPGSRDHELALYFDGELRKACMALSQVLPHVLGLETGLAERPRIHSFSSSIDRNG